MHYAKVNLRAVIDILFFFLAIQEIMVINELYVLENNCKEPTRLTKGKMKMKMDLKFKWTVMLMAF